MQTFTIFYRKAEESKILYKEGIGDKGNTEKIKSTVYFFFFFFFHNIIIMTKLDFVYSTYIFTKLTLF